jgi:hypothetical protein
MLDMGLNGLKRDQKGLGDNIGPCAHIYRFMHRTPITEASGSSQDGPVTFRPVGNKTTVPILLYTPVSCSDLFLYLLSIAPACLEYWLG